MVLPALSVTLAVTIPVSITKISPADNGPVIRSSSPFVVIET